MVKEIIPKKKWNNPRMKIEEAIYPHFVEVFEMNVYDTDPGVYDDARAKLDQAIEDVYNNVYAEPIQVPTRFGYYVGKIESCLIWPLAFLLAIPAAVIFIFLLIFSRKFRRKLASQD